MVAWVEASNRVQGIDQRLVETLFYIKKHVGPNKFIACYVTQFWVQPLEFKKKKKKA